MSQEVVNVVIDLIRVGTMRLYVEGQEAILGLSLQIPVVQVSPNQQTPPPEVGRVFLPLSVAEKLLEHLPVMIQRAYQKAGGKDH